MNALCHLPLNNKIIDKILDMRIKEDNHVYLKIQLKPCWVKEEDLVDYKEEVKRFIQARKLKREVVNQEIKNLPPPPSYNEACKPKTNQLESNYRMLDPSIYQQNEPAMKVIEKVIDNRPIQFVENGLTSTQSLLKQAKTICDDLRKRSAGEKSTNEITQIDVKRKRRVTFDNPCFETISGEHAAISDKTPTKDRSSTSISNRVLNEISIAADKLNKTPSPEGEGWTWEELHESGHFHFDDGVYDFCTDDDLSDNWKVDMMTKPWMETNMDEFAECTIL